MGGRRIVLAASDSESTEYLHSCWRQMLLATLPARFARFPFHLADVSVENEVAPDGQAVYVPNGLRVVEALLLREFSPDDIAVCHPGELDRFVGANTRVVGVHAHNPIGITFAAGVYTQMYGGGSDPVNAVEFRRLILHPAIARHRDHLRIIVGGPGVWQIAAAGLQQAWGIDCLVDGEAETVTLPLFKAAINGEPLPARVKAQKARIDEIPPIRHRSTLGVVEITRGCGRGCDFCAYAARQGTSLPLEHILRDVQTQVAEGAEAITLVTEDLFLYEQGPRFTPNVDALGRLLHDVAAVPGVRHVLLSHATMAPVVRNPELLDVLSPVAVDRAITRHPASTHSDHRYAMPFLGLETGSVRLFERLMKGKSYPFRPQQWPDVVLKGMELLNRHNWFPFCTFVIGLPGETEDDTRESLDLLHGLRTAKWCVVPTFFVPLDDTRLRDKGSARIAELTELQWEFFFTCWRYNLDFFRNTRSVQWRFNIGVPLYYYLMGRRLLGRRIKYPILRLAHVPEPLLRRRLYLDLTRPGYRVPDAVLVPPESMRA